MEDSLIGMGVVSMIIFIVGIALIFAPLFIWNRCNQILEEKKRANAEAEKQREKIIKLLTFIANELTKH